MVAKLKAFWGTLPHQVQAAITVFAAAIGVTVLKNAASGNHIFMCADWNCVKEHISTAMSSGAAALIAFYMRPNQNGATTPPPEVKP